MRIATQLILAVLAVVPARGSTLPAVAPGMKRWIVTFKPAVKREGREKDLAALNLKAVAHIATDGDSENEFSAAVVDLPSGQALPLAWPVGKAVYEAPPDVRADLVSMEPDQRVKWIEQVQASFQATPLPSVGGLMQGLKFPKAGQFPRHSIKETFGAVRPELTWGVNRVHAPAAWDVTEGAGVKVAVIDTGIDMNHPDLIGKVDGGYSAIKKSELPDDYSDDNGHGTHVSGIIAAARDGKGVVGVAPKARLYSVKVLDADGGGNLSDVIDGIVWAAKNDMQVVNMSLSAPIDSEALHNAVRSAKGHGVVIVVAAGNTGGPVGYPAAYPEVIAVSASAISPSDGQDELAPFSSRGSQVQFAAPGMDVVSDRLGGGLVSFSGTSMAAPHVAGLAALSVSLGYVGLSGPDGVLAQLKKASKPLALLKPEEQGFGMIDAGKLVR